MRELPDSLRGKAYGLAALLIHFSAAGQRAHTLALVAHFDHAAAFALHMHCDTGCACMVYRIGGEVAGASAATCVCASDRAIMLAMLAGNFN